MTAFRDAVLSCRAAQATGLSGVTIAVLLLLASPGSSAPLAVQGQPPIDSLVAITDVNVVSMRVEGVEPAQTVLVRAGWIVAVGPSSAVDVPRHARRIDGRGRYLMPGLTDFHVHIGERTDLARYLAAGVTTTVNMGGNAAALIAWRDSVRTGSLIGPDIYVGSFLNGPLGIGGGATVQTTASVRGFVSTRRALGFDFLKAYNSLTEEQFLVAVEEARKAGLPILGHAVRRVGLRRAVAAGQRVIAHAEEYIYDELQSQDDALIPSALEFTKAAGTYVIPNLSAYDVITRQWGRRAFVDSVLSTPEGRNLSPLRAAGWRDADYVRRAGALVALPFLMRLTAQMQRAGIPLLLGTDSPIIPGMFAGTSIHHDLELLVAAGLTPFEALTAGTRNAGEFARREFGGEAFGVIAPGYRADLVMLAANPLADVRNAHQPLGVLTRGRWLTPEFLRDLWR